MKQTTVEWLLDRIEDVDNTPEIWELIKIKAKEMENQKLEQFYNHGKWAIIEHGHGDTFEDYYNKTFKQD